MPLIRQIENAQIVGDGLQVAVAAAYAARALRIVLGQQQLHVGATGLAGLGAVGADHHAVEHVVVAGGDELVAALNLDHAYATAADLVQIAQIAQGGNLDADGLGCVQNRGVLGNHDLAIIDSKLDHVMRSVFGVVADGGVGGLYHSRFLPPRNAPKPK